MGSTRDILLYHRQLLIFGRPGRQRHPVDNCPGEAGTRLSNVVRCKSRTPRPATNDDTARGCARQGPCKKVGALKSLGQSRGAVPCGWSADDSEVLIRQVRHRRGHGRWTQNASWARLKRSHDASRSGSQAHVPALLQSSLLARGSGHARYVAVTCRDTGGELGDLAPGKRRRRLDLREYFESILRRAFYGRQEPKIVVSTQLLSHSEPHCTLPWMSGSREH
jgi:hypothetical protein